MTLDKIIIYPIKSLGGVNLVQSNCKFEGLEHDRRMMLVDKNGKFISQREIPEMALLKTEVSNHGINVFHVHKHEEKIHIPFDFEVLTTNQVQVWNHQFQAGYASPDISEWFSDILHEEIYLAKQTNDSNRNKSLIKAPGKTPLSMADGYPYLVLSSSSLDDLNSKLDKPVQFDRFRPNIIVSNEIPYEEEEWDKFNLGSTTFRMIKPCARCIMITIDQNSGEKLVEPLKTLSTYKKRGNNVYFGMNAVVLSEGTIHVGDQLKKI